MRKYLLFLTFLALVVGIISCEKTTEPFRPHRSLIYVDSNNITGDEDGSIFHPYSSIQKGIDEAEPGATVAVFAGIYEEPQIRLKGELTVRGAGADRTVILNGLIGEDVSNVVVTSFEIQSGLQCTGNSDLIINHNLFTGSAGGVIVSDSSRVIIRQNTFRVQGMVPPLLCSDESYSVVQANIFEQGGMPVIMELSAMGDFGGGGDSNGNNDFSGQFPQEVLRNATPNALMAENNTWRFNTAEEIDRYDIVDDDENAGFGMVDFEPFILKN